MGTTNLFLSTKFMTKPFWMWLIFFAVVMVLLLLDLGILHRESKEIGVRESLVMTCSYIGLGLCFGIWVWQSLGEVKALEYLTGFVVEKTLAMDNVFVISMIFGFLKIPTKYQHRVLTWGILGVIVLRGLMIAIGAALIEDYSWVIYLFASFLIISGFKMLFFGEQERDLSDNFLLRQIRRMFRVTPELHGERFFVTLTDSRSGKSLRYVTPLFVALLMVESADVIFAVDSVPAIFAITTDPYIVFTSNIFAILGLRALYFALAAFVERFKYLKVALSVLLIFIGSKIFLADLFWPETSKFPAWLSLTITFTILTTGIAYSVTKTKNETIDSVS